jgi:hypothetical protein
MPCANADALADLDDDAAADAVGQDAAIEREEEAGDAVRQLDIAEGREGARDVVGEVAASHLLHLQCGPVA